MCRNDIYIYYIYLHISYLNINRSWIIGGRLPHPRHGMVPPCHVLRTRRADVQLHFPWPKWTTCSQESPPRSPCAAHPCTRIATPLPYICTTCVVSIRISYTACMLSCQLCTSCVLSCSQASTHILCTVCMLITYVMRFWYVLHPIHFFALHIWLQYTASSYKLPVSTCMPALFICMYCVYCILI